MKTLQHFLFFALCPAFFLASCDTNDDGFYNEAYVEASNLVAIEMQPSYNVNDVVYINASIPNFLTETGQSTLLDIRKTTGNADSFNFSYILEKKSASNTWEYIDIGTNYVSNLGNANIGSFVQAISQYQAASSSYDYRGGIRLVETGEYRLSFGYNSGSVNLVELRSNSIGNNLFLNINSAINSLNSEGFYTFMVN